LTDGQDAGFATAAVAGTGMVDTTSNQASISFVVAIQITTGITEATGDIALIAFPTGT